MDDIEQDNFSKMIDRRPVGFVRKAAVPRTDKMDDTGLEHSLTPLSVVALPNKQRELTLEYVGALLARCESGEVVAVTVLEERNDGTYLVGGGGTMSRLQTAGALLDAAITRLTD